MRANSLVLRCMAEQVDGQWQALCLDLCLAAQADTLEEVRAKLEAMICEYVHDAVEGEDRPYAGQLLNRRAPLAYWLKFYFYRALVALRASSKRILPFSETLPLVPACH